MKTLKIMIVGCVVAAGMSRPCFAYPGNQESHYFERDTSYEQALKYEASADKTVTPAKVLRWVMGLRGQVVTAPPPSRTEFQPIVNAHDGHVRLIAALAFKF